jgi:hypothetical protein
MKWLGSFGSKRAVAVLVALTSVAVAGSADAHVRRAGQWPAPTSDKAVTLDLDGVPRAKALQKLADAAGWSIVVKTPPGEVMDVHVKGQPAGKVLDVILSDGDYLATRDGTLVSIERDSDPGAAIAPESASAPASSSASGSASASSSALAGASAKPPVPATPPVPAAPPGSSGLQIKLGSDGSEVDEPHAHGKDRTVMGGNVRIAKGEHARDVTVFGGNVEIEGEVTGDVSVFGGNVHLYDGAHVHGDATVFGGELELDPGSRVDGDVGTLGGHVDRKPGAVVGGSVSVKGGDADDSGEGASESSPPAVPPHHISVFGRALSAFTGGVRLAALLFVIGTVLIALAGRRMEMLRGEAAARPMRSIALGLLGAFMSIFVFVALCVTVIGIPVAIVALMVAAFAGLGGMCAVLSVVGEGLLRHRTQNPYVHLAVGCAIFVALAWIPWVGGFVVAAVVLAGIGVLVATRLAGMLVKRNGGAAGPYRTPA